MNFFDAVSGAGKIKVVEGAVVGFRTAGLCLACNDRYFTRKAINWDPVAIKVVG